MKVLDAYLFTALLFVLASCDPAVRPEIDPNSGEYDSMANADTASLPTVRIMQVQLNPDNNQVNFTVVTGNGTVKIQHGWKDIGTATGPSSQNCNNIVYQPTNVFKVTFIDSAQTIGRRILCVYGENQQGQRGTVVNANWSKAAPELGKTIINVGVSLFGDIIDGKGRIPDSNRGTIFASVAKDEGSEATHYNSCLIDDGRDCPQDDSYAGAGETEGACMWNADEKSNFSDEDDDNNHRYDLPPLDSKKNEDSRNFTLCVVGIKKDSGNKVIATEIESYLWSRTSNPTLAFKGALPEVGDMNDSITIGLEKGGFGVIIGYNYYFAASDDSNSGELDCPAEEDDAEFSYQALSDDNDNDYNFTVDFANKNSTNRYVCVVAVYPDLENQFSSSIEHEWSTESASTIPAVSPPEITPNESVLQTLPSHIAEDFHLVSSYYEKKLWVRIKNTGTAELTWRASRIDGRSFNDINFTEKSSCSMEADYDDYETVRRGIMLEGKLAPNSYTCVKFALRGTYHTYYSYRGKGCIKIEFENLNNNEVVRKEVCLKVPALELARARGKGESETFEDLPVDEEGKKHIILTKQNRHKKIAVLNAAFSPDKPDEDLHYKVHVFNIPNWFYYLQGEYHNSPNNRHYHVQVGLRNSAIAKHDDITLPSSAADCRYSFNGKNYCPATKLVFYTNARSRKPKPENEILPYSTAERKKNNILKISRYLGKEECNKANHVPPELKHCSGPVIPFITREVEIPFRTKRANPVYGGPFNKKIMVTVLYDPN